METGMSIHAVQLDNDQKNFKKEEKETVVSNITVDEHFCDHLQVLAVNTTGRGHIPSLLQEPRIISTKSTIHKLDDASQILTKFSNIPVPEKEKPSC
jgi:hypothetical protein